MSHTPIRFCLLHRAGARDAAQRKSNRRARPPAGQICQTQAHTPLTRTKPSRRVCTNVRAGKSICQPQAALKCRYVRLFWHALQPSWTGVGYSPSKPGRLPRRRRLSVLSQPMQEISRQREVVYRQVWLAQYTYVRKTSCASATNKSLGSTALSSALPDNAVMASRDMPPFSRTESSLLSPRTPTFSCFMNIKVLTSGWSVRLSHNEWPWSLG